MRVEEETQARTKIIHLQATTQRPFDILNTVIQRERQFLQRSGTSFADVITTYRNRVEARSELRPELKCVHHQTHGWRWRIDVFLLRDVLLQNVVLDGP